MWPAGRTLAMSVIDNGTYGMWLQAENIRFDYIKSHITDNIISQLKLLNLGDFSDEEVSCSTKKLVNVHTHIVIRQNLAQSDHIKLRLL